MSKIKTLVAAGLIVPLLALGAIANSEQSDSLSAPSARPSAPYRVMDTADAYTCCWVYYLGRWYCIPC